MDKINKALIRLSDKQRAQLLQKFELICVGQITGLNIKKMKGHKQLYRLRSGDIRLVYIQELNKKPVIVYIGKRDEQTYKDF